MPAVGGAASASRCRHNARMSLALSPSTDLHHRLSQLAHQPPLADYLCVVARREHGVKAAFIERPTLGILLHGEKRLYSDTFDIDVAESDVFLVTRPCHLNAINTPDPRSSLYLTLAVPLCDEVLEAARLLWAKPVPTTGPDALRVAGARLQAELSDWCSALQRGQMGAARLAITATLLRLCEWGHASVLAPLARSLATQMRCMVTAEPERDWRSQDFEMALALSGATLRRRLAEENTTMSDVVTEARLAQALSLLYTTRWPLKTVAARVGYRSVPSFTRRFTERFGIEPGAIGNAAAGQAAAIDAPAAPIEWQDPTARQTA